MTLRMLTVLLFSLPLLLAGCEQDSPTSPASLPDVDWDKCHQPPTPPASSTVIDSATLHVRAFAVNGGAVTVHRVSAAWDEATVTHASFAGAFDAAPVDSFPADVIGWHEVDVTALVAGWVAGEFDNHGLLLDQSGATPFAKFFSREATGNHPWLEVCYTTAEGSFCDTTETIGDTYVWGNHADTNYGASTELATGWREPAPQEKQSLLAFDVSFVPAGSACAPCSGQLTSLSLRYLGDESARIKVYRGLRARGGRLLYSGRVAPQEVFTLDGTIGARISIYVDGKREARFVTNCALPIGLGTVRGDFEVVAGASRFGGPLCADNSAADAAWCDLGKPRALTLRYTGESCDETEHEMSDDNVSCCGNPDLASRVRIIASDRANPNHRQARVWFNGIVDLDETFTLEADRAGVNRLGGTTFVLVYDLHGHVLQRVTFHTSCSEPLTAGDQFGSMVLEDFLPW